MSKRVTLYVVFALIAAFMSAGCAKQNVVKKDEGIAPTAASKSDAPKSQATPPKQTAATPVTKAVPAQPAAAQQSLKTSSAAELQSALETIYFNFDSADLSDSSRNTLAANAATLAKQAASKIRIEGNCDERGSAEYNLALGERRAKAAQQYLITMGVKPDRLSVISYGKEKPATRGHDEAAWSKNRRDEFVVVTK